MSQDPDSTDTSPGEEKREEVETTGDVTGQGEIINALQRRGMDPEEDDEETSEKDDSADSAP